MKPSIASKCSVSRVLRFALPAMLALQLGHFASAANNTFSAGTSWNVAGDWSTGATPATTDALLFNSTDFPGIVTLDNSFTADTLSINDSGAIVINGNASGTTARSLTLDNTALNANGTSDVVSVLGGAVVTVGSANGTLTLALPAASNINVGNGSSLTFGSSSTITDSGNLSFSGNSTGLLVLQAANAGLTGGVTLTSGSVRITNGNALGSSTSDPLVLDGGTLDLTLPSTTITQYPTTINGNTTILTDRSTAGAGQILELGAVTLESGTLTAGVGSNVTSAGERLEFNGSTTLTGNTTINTTGGNLLVMNLTGALSGNFNLTFESTDGTGDASIRGATASTRTSGTTTLLSGILNLNSSSTPDLLGAGTSLLLTGGTLQFADSGGQTAYPTIVNGNVNVQEDNTGGGLDYAMTNLSIGTNTLTASAGSATTSIGSEGIQFGATTLTGNPTFNTVNGTVSSTLTLGALNDGGTARTITITGNGIVAFNAVATSLVNGTKFVVSSGSLNASAAGDIGTLATVDVADGAFFNVSASQTVGALTDVTSSLNTAAVTVASGQTLTVGNLANNLSSTFSGVIGGAGSLAKSGVGTLTLTGSSTYTGATSVNVGTLVLDMNALSHSNGVLAPTSTLNLGGGTLIVKGAGSGASTQTVGNFALTNGGGKSAMSTLVINNNGGSGTTLNLGTITASTAGSSLLIDDSLGGTVTSTGSSTNGGIYSGRIVYYDGTNYNWAATTSSAAPYTLSGYTGYTSLVATGASSSTNYLQTDAGSVTASESLGTLKVTTTQSGQSLTISSGQTLTLNSSGLLFTGANNYTITGGTLTANNGAGGYDLIIDQYSSTNALTINSTILNDGGNGIDLIKNGPGTLDLTQSADGYTGGTFLNGGVINFTVVSDLGSGGITFNGGTLQWNSTTDISSRVVTINAGGGTIDTQGNNVSFASSIGSGGAGGLTKIGTGTLTLNGSNNNYTGGTMVNAGILLVSGSLTGTGAVTVNSGATLGGSGLIDGATTVATSGTLNPGAGLAVGTNLTINAGVTFNNGSTFEVNIDSVGNTVDKLTIGGTSDNLTLNGADTLTFNLVNGTSLDNLAPGTYILASYTGNLTGTFAPDGTLQSNWSISYATPDQIDLIVAVPEPGTWATVIGGLGLLLVGQKFRRRTIR